MAQNKLNLLETALTHHRSGQLEDAKSIYKQILNKNPSHPDALHLMGVVLLQTGHAIDAAKYIRKAANLQPRNGEFHANLGHALFECGQFADAEVAYLTGAALMPADPSALMGAANSSARLGNFARAETILRELTQKFPDFALAWLNLGHVVNDQGRPTDALTHYKRAVAIDPQLANAHNSAGSALMKLARLAEAEAAFRRAVAIAPDYFQAWCNLTSVLIDQGNSFEAETTCRRALKLEPHFADAHLMLGSALGFQHRYDEMRSAYQRAVELEPENLRALMSLSLALRDAGDMTAADHMLARAGALAPDSPEIPYSTAQLKLAQGHLREGWSDYRFRPGRCRFKERHPDIKLADALPATLDGKTVCIAREQGLGDEIFFLRFIAALKQRGAAVVYRTNPKLRELLAQALDTVITQEETLPKCDFIALVGDLPYLLDPERFLPPLLLAPSTSRVKALCAQLEQLGPPPYVGLTWRGGIAPGEQRGINWGLFKEIGAGKFAQALAGVTGTFLALQRNPRQGEITDLATALGKPLHDLSTLNEDLEGMLALLSVIDEYIGVSNTNMHLRAAAGKTARVLVPHPPEWRWMSMGDESSWFPGFKVYRQSKSGDWTDAVSALRNDLQIAQ